MKRLFVVILMAVILATVILPAQRASAAWFDSAWSYRKSHTIQSGSGAGTGYQKHIVVHRTSGTDSGKDVYLGTKPNADFGDIRFTRADGRTEISYALDHVATDTAHFFVRVPVDLDTQNFDMYIYYGNSGATTTSQPENVFEYYVDFNDYSILGHAGSQDAESSQYEVIDGGKTLRMYGNNWKSINKTDFDVSSDGSRILEWWFDSDGEEGEINGVGLNDSNNLESSRHYQIWGTQNWNYGIESEQYSGSNDWELMTQVLDDYSSANVSYWVFSNDADSGQATDVKYKNVRVRKNASTEPAHGSWGSEQTLSNYDSVMGSSSYKLRRDSVNAGGTDFSTSSSYQLHDTLGEIGTGKSTSTSYELYAGYRQMEAGQISITPADNVVLSPDIGGVTGGTSNGSTSFNVTTDSPAGYEVTIQASGSPALQRDAGGDSFADYSASGSDPDFTFSVANNTSEFGFTPEGGDIADRFKDDGNACNTGSGDTADRCWDGLSTTAATIVKSTSSNNPDGATTTLKFRAQSGSSHVQKEGTYTATTTITAFTL